jgi:predicted lipoprotein with Yx(FWY)xxD motif
MKKLTLLITAALAALGIGAAAAMTTPARTPAIRYVDDQFGPILATPKKQALYYWTRENDYKIHCKRECAKLWPPLIVRSRTAVPRHIAGITGTFGTIRRPDGRLQVTFKRRPVYTYIHEEPTEVRCDDVGGWFVVRLRGS